MIGLLYRSNKRMEWMKETMWMVRRTSERCTRPLCALSKTSAPSIRTRDGLHPLLRPAERLVWTAPTPITPWSSSSQSRWTLGSMRQWEENRKKTIYPAKKKKRKVRPLDLAECSQTAWAVECATCAGTEETPIIQLIT